MINILSPQEAAFRRMLKTIRGVSSSRGGRTMTMNLQIAAGIVTMENRYLVKNVQLRLVKYFLFWYEVNFRAPKGHA